MSPVLLFSFVIGYFVLLLVVAWFTSRNSNNESFFIGNRKSNWVLVAFGMIGTSLSGVTFVSVPGAVGKPFAGGFEGFTYFQIVIGYLIGYMIIAFVLLPLYYRLNLTSIYTYLSKRLGFVSYKTGASFFYPVPHIGCDSTSIPGSCNFAKHHSFQLRCPFLVDHADHTCHDPALYIRGWCEDYCLDGYPANLLYAPWSSHMCVLHFKIP